MSLESWDLVDGRLHCEPMDRGLDSTGLHLRRIAAMPRSTGPRGVPLAIYQHLLEINAGFEQVRVALAALDIETAFVIPGDTRGLTIQVMRRPSLKLDYKIRGTVWIDAVSLQVEQPLSRTQSRNRAQRPQT